MALFFVMKEKDIKIADYSYILPQEKIAKYPLEKRDSSNLLLYKNNNVEKKKFSEIAKLLPKNNLLIMNNTKVINARLIFRKPTGAKIEVFCLNPHNPSEYNLSFEAKHSCTWHCIVGNQKKWKNEDIILEFEYEKIINQIIAKKIKKLGTNQIIEFQWKNDLTFGEILDITGNIPIPPYLNRSAEESDKTRYQTVYSKFGGSVAAPTAGLHFTKEIFEKLEKQNISIAEITLHVGAGTFKPVKTEEISGHEMHTEFFQITKENLQKINKNIGNITPVGTTSLRTIESLYWMGVKKHFHLPNYNEIKQWEIYELPKISVEDALNTLLNVFDEEKTNIIHAYTQIIIVPGYDFKLVNSLITNFHQPNSTLLLLIAAFVGKDWEKIYDFALNNEFRFLSYGDSSLLMK